MSGERVKLTSEEKRKKYLPAIPELNEETILTVEGDDDSDDEPPPPKEKGFLKLPSKLGGKLGGGPKRSFRSEEEVIMESHQDGEVEEVIKQASNKDDLTLNCYKFDTFPDALFSCGGLVTLTAHLNGLKEISPRIDHLQMLVSLNLGQNELTTLPPEIGDLSSLQHLDINRNKLTSLPDTLSKLKLLQSINLDYNNLPSIPECLTKIENLQRCYFIENERIQTFPAVEALANWKNCRLAVDNCPSLKEAWNQVYEQLPGIQLMWNKVYPDQVLDHVFLGSVRTAQSAKVFKQLEITRIVTAGKQLEVIDPIPEGVHQLILNVEDIPEQGLVQAFDEVVHYIEKARTDGARVLVHCFAGLSRSVTFTCAYLMKIYGMTFKESIVMIKKARPNVNPNTGFRKQLIQYEWDLHGTRLDPADKENEMNSVE